MNTKELLIHNLYRQFEKDKWNMKQVLSIMNEVMLVTKRDNLKISMIIKIEEDKK